MLGRTLHNKTTGNGKGKNIIRSSLAGLEFRREGSDRVPWFVNILCKCHKYWHILLHGLGACPARGLGHGALGHAPYIGLALAVCWGLAPCPSPPTQRIGLPHKQAQGGLLQGLR